MVIAGHSYGGALAYVMAAEYPACIAIDAPAEPDPGIVDQIQPVLDRLEVTFPSMDSYLEHVKAMPWFESKWNDQLEVFYRTDVQQLPDGSVRSRAHPTAIRDAITGLLDVDLAALVASITVPTLLIRAIEPLQPGAPLLFPEEEAEQALTSLADGRLIEIKGNHYDVVLGRAATEPAAAIRHFVAET